jgi:hypothetical protein
LPWRNLAQSVRWIRTVSKSKISKTTKLFSKIKIPISHTHSQASWTLRTYISQMCTSQMCTHGGVYLVGVYLTYTGVHLAHKRVLYGRASHGRVSHGRVSHGRASYGRASHRRTSHGRAPHENFQILLVDLSRSELQNTSLCASCGVVPIALRTRPQLFEKYCSPRYGSA